MQQQPIVPPVQQTQQQQIPVPQTQQYYQSKSPILPSQPSLPIKTQDDGAFLKNSIEQTAPSYQNNVPNDHHRNLQKDHMSVYNDDAWDPSYDNVQTSSSTKPLQPSTFKVIDSQPTFASKDLQKDKSPAIQKGFNDATTQTDPDHIDLTIINLMQQKYLFTITLPNNKVIPPSKLSQFIDVFTESQKTSLPITKINNNVAAVTTAPSYSSNINNDLLKDTSQSYLIRFDDNDYQKSPQVIQQPSQKSPQLTHNKYNDNEILDTVRKDDLIAHPHQPVQHQKTPSSNFGNDNQRGWIDGNIPQQQQSNWGKGPVATSDVAPVVKSAETWNNGPQKSPLQQQQPNQYNDNGISDTSGKNRDLIAPPHPPVQHQQAPSSNFSSNSQRGWIDGNTPQPQQPIPQQLPPQTPPVATPAVAPVATGVESWENEVKEEGWLEKAAKFEQELNVDPKVRIGIDDGRTNSTTANNISPAVTNSHSNGYGRGGANKEYQGIGNGSGRPNAKALWDQLLRAETENDLPKFKRIFEEYTTAAPVETFQSIAKDLRSAKSNAKLLALDQSHTNNIASMTSRSLVDLQGNCDKKYLVYITFGPPNSVPPELGRIASSHISKNCPESSRRDNRGGDINNRPPLQQQYSSSTYENRNGAGGAMSGGNDYHFKSYESRYSSGSGGNNMMGGGSNNSSSAKKCYQCGSSDHIARYCEEQQSRFGSGSGGGDRGDYQQRRGYNNNNGYDNPGVKITILIII
ncbi:3933_t:CDS:2 [Entrophospora sp. SA101]|nr:3933_t:CDS:2 [Entrophospora sp. SA101]CAJ0921571.1 21622_t:CDS:2 [Entrophospora sp. SA101]